MLPCEYCSVKILPWAFISTLIASACWVAVRGAGGVVPVAETVGVACYVPVLVGGTGNWSTCVSLPWCLAAAVSAAEGLLDWPTTELGAACHDGLVCCPVLEIFVESIQF